MAVRNDSGFLKSPLPFLIMYLRLSNSCLELVAGGIVMATIRQYNCNRQWPQKVIRPLTGNPAPNSIVPDSQRGPPSLALLFLPLFRTASSLTWDNWNSLLIFHLPRLFHQPIFTVVPLICLKLKHDYVTLFNILQQLPIISRLTPKLFSHKSSSMIWLVSAIGPLKLYSLTRARYEVGTYSVNVCGLNEWLTNK